MLIRTIKMSFWVFYDHIAKLLLINLLCIAWGIIPLLYIEVMTATGGSNNIHGLVAVMIVMIAVPLSLVGILSLVKELIEKHDGSFRLFYIGIRRFGLQAFILEIAYLFAFACVISCLYFYGSIAGQYSPIVKYGLGAFSVWALLLLSATAFYSFPALINRRAGIIDAIKLSVALVVDNPLFTLGILFHIVLLLIVCATAPLLLCFLFAPIVVLQGSAYEMLARKYSALTAHRNRHDGRNEAFTIDFGDENDEYLCRGFRDLLFPWKE